jgi:hypothetical protein
MWEMTVVAKHEKHVDAPREKVWDLLGSVGALSFLPAGVGGFAWEVPAVVPGTNRLCCLLRSKPIRCSVLDVREEVPGQQISWQWRNVANAGKQHLTLSVLPGRRGCVMSFTSVVTVPRGHDHEEIRQRQWLREWSDRLLAIAEVRAAGPQAVMPQLVQQEYARRPPVKKPALESAMALIKAPADVVWESVWTLENESLLHQNVVFSGNVPGTPERAPGQIEYSVWRLPDDGDLGVFTARAAIVREVSDGRRVVTQSLAAPHDEITWLVTAVPGGTQLEVAVRWSTRGKNAYRERRQAWLREGLPKLIDARKTSCESTA